MFVRLLLHFSLLACLPAFGSVTVTVNGSSHTIPQTNEKGWGSNVTAWIQAISQYTLQPSGGTFTLTAETDFGATYGLKGPYFKTATATPSTVGVLRLANTDSLGWRNAGNSANLLLAVDSSNNLTFGGVIVPTATATSVQDSTFTIYDNGDNTKKIAFEASGITTGTTRTWTVPDANGTFVGISNTQTLTNKTLTSPIISSISNTGTLTLPTSSDTLVGRATTDTLTNKTMSGSSNTFTNIDLTASVTGVLPIANGGTNSSTSLNNNRVMVSSGSKIAEASAITASRALVSDSNGIPTHATTTSTEIGYVNGVTSAIQTQLDAKVAKSTATTKGDIYVATGSATVVRQGIGSDGQLLTADSAQTNGLKWADPTAAPSSPKEISNCTFATSVASHALTIALKDSSGSDPSAGSACKIGFRNATATTGTYTQVSTTGATSLVVSNGSALGCTATVTCTLYVYAINNAGTVELAVSGWGLFDEGTVQSSTAEGGSGGADTGDTLYSTSARSSKAVRLLGRITITPAASFQWDANATELSNTPFERYPLIGLRYTDTAGSAIGTGFGAYTYATKTYDPQGIYASGTATIKVAGTYHISAGISNAAQTLSNQTLFQIEIVKNGTAYAVGTTVGNGGTNNTYNVIVTDTVSLAVGDTISIQARCGSATTANTTTGWNWFSMERIGP